MAVFIRKPIPADVNAIAFLHLAAWKEAYVGMVPAHVLDELSLDGFSSRWNERIKNSKTTEHTLIAEQQGEVLGFVSFGDSREAMDLPQNYGEIYALYVHPHRWRNGAGKALIQAAFLWFEENRVPGVFLWTLKENQRARKFYERMGMYFVPQERYITTHGAELLCCCYCNKSIL